MVFISRLEEITEVKYSIGFIHYCPFDPINGLGKTEDELKHEGILLDAITAPEVKEGFSTIMYYNPITQNVFFDYIELPNISQSITTDPIIQDNTQTIESPKPLEEQVSDLREEVNALKYIIKSNGLKI